MLRRTLPALVDGGSVRRAGPGRPRQRPERLVADRSCSNRFVRDALRRRGIGSLIPQPRDQHPGSGDDQAADRARNRVERLLGRLKPSRRMATRYAKRAANDLAMLQVAPITLWRQG